MRPFLVRTLHLTSIIECRHGVLNHMQFLLCTLSLHFTLHHCVDVEVFHDPSFHCFLDSTLASCISYPTCIFACGCEESIFLAHHPQPTFCLHLIFGCGCGGLCDPLVLLKQRLLPFIYVQNTNGTTVRIFRHLGASYDQLVVMCC